MVAKKLSTNMNQGNNTLHEPQYIFRDPGIRSLYFNTVRE